MINHQIYDTATMLGVLRDDEMMQPPSNYWLSLCFPGVINFTDEYIDFSKITENRKLAPLVVPTAQGKPIYSAAERLSRVKPAYVKPKDPVTASRMIKRAAGFGELQSATPQTPQQRYNAIVADIMRQHRRAIERRWEWLAAQAIIYGEVTLEDEAYPKTVVEFERAANHYVDLTGATQWGETGVSIINNINTWRKRVRDAPFGGGTNRMTMGSDAWEVLRQDAEIKELLKVDYRPYNNGVNLNLGLTEGLDVEFVGRLSGTLDLYVYSDYYQEPDGTVTPFMSSKDIVLTGPNVAGVRCFGAIQDINAQFQPLAIFPKMWQEQDPSATFVMHQSAPLMVPVNPNNTFRASVLD
jgi:hypothetical protein